MLRCGRYITPLLPPVQLIPRKVRQFFYLFSTFVYIFVWRDASQLMAKLITPLVNCICQKQVPGGGGTPIHYLYGYVPPKGVVILKLLI